MPYLKRGSVADNPSSGKSGDMDKGSVAYGKRKRKMGKSDEKGQEKVATRTKKGTGGHGFGY
jgi:hypothetical protein